MPEFLYHNYVKTLSKRFMANLSTIEAGANFEYGPEFEIAMCETFRNALPDRYGIARGYVVNANGEQAGDDILVFEQSRFPTLALRKQDDYARKEFIPIEAAYCYVEAKHTLNLEGNDPQSLKRACEQVSRVKTLCNSRPAVLPSQLGPYLNVGSSIHIKSPSEFPDIMNPMFGAVFARQARRRKGEAVLTDPQEIEAILTGTSIETSELPDIIVIGENNVIVPALPNENNKGARMRSPFFIKGRSTCWICQVEGIAFGIGLASVMAALDWIHLGVLPWHRIIVDGLGIPYE